MIIDAHIHAGLPDFCAGTAETLPRELCVTYAEVLSVMDTYGVNRAVLIPIPHRDIDTHLTNQYVLEAHKAFPERFIPFCRINDCLEENLASGFQGVKIHMVYEDIDIHALSGSLRTIENAGVPLMVHAKFADKVRQVEDIMSVAPEMKIILAHMGRGHIYTEEQVLQNAAGLRQYSNVYFETSTSGGIESIVKVCDILGADRVIYGSDYPFGKSEFGAGYEYDRDMQAVREAFSPEQAEKILGGNIMRLLAKGESVTVRPSRPEDYEGIIALLDSLDDREKKFLALAVKYQAVKKVLRTGKHSYTAEIGGRIAGFLMESGRPEGYSYIEEIAVAPEFRHKGVGKALLKHYLDIFPKSLAKTNSHNSPIINLLSQNGYIPDNPDAPRIINWKRN